MISAIHSSVGETLLASPGEPRYAEAIASYNLASNIDPAYAVTVSNVAEIRDVLAVARERGLGVRVMTTGHGSDADAPYSGEILVRTRLEGEVVIDPVAATATFPAGTVWADVVAAAAPHGLTALHGSSGTVGATGYLLGGGLSFYGRMYGLASNLVTSIELVLADGSLVTADASNDPELFYALRGGGGGFGVVVSVTISLIRVESVATGITFWSGKDAAAVLAAWEAWTLTAPRTISTSFRVMNLPPIPGIPPQLTAGPIVGIDGASLDEGDRSGLDLINDLLDPLRKRFEPIFDTWHVGPPTDVLASHMDPPDPIPYLADHFLVDALGTEGQSAMLSLAGQPGGDAILMAELRQLGGAFGEPNAQGGALNKLDAAHAFIALGVVAGPEAGPRIGTQLAQFRERLSPWDTGYTTPTFVSNCDAPRKSFSDDVAARVAVTRNRVDPDGRFRSNVR